MTSPSPSARDLADVAISAVLRGDRTLFLEAVLRLDVQADGILSMMTPWPASRDAAPVAPTRVAIAQAFNVAFDRAVADGSPDAVVVIAGKAVGFTRVSPVVLADRIGELRRQPELFDASAALALRLLCLGVLAGYGK